MPASRSPKQSNKQQPQLPQLPPQRSRFWLPLTLVVVMAVLVVAVAAMPASLLRHLLPAFVRAEDFSGSVWHGSAGKLTVDLRDAGALEWRLHPLSLLGLRLSADVHWVMVGFVADASVETDGRNVTARDLHGGGPVEDLNAVGVGAGWSGSSTFKISELKLKFDEGKAIVLSAVGELGVEGLASRQIAGGANLGGYVMHAANGAITPDTDATAELSDTGGPLEVQASIHFSVREHTGLLSGTIKERSGAPAALTAQIRQLEQMHARDARGRIPVELEFTL